MYGYDFGFNIVHKTEYVPLCLTLLVVSSLEGAVKVEF